MKRLASTRSEKCARQPLPPAAAQCSVGSMEDDGIRYGFTTNDLIAKTIATAPTIVTIQSMIARHGWGTPSRTSGLNPCGRSGSGSGSGKGSGSVRYGHDEYSDGLHGGSSDGGGGGSYGGCDSYGGGG